MTPLPARRMVSGMGKRASAEDLVSAAAAIMGRRGARARLRKMTKAQLSEWGKKMRAKRYANMTKAQRSAAASHAIQARWAGHKPKRRRR